MCYTKGEEFSGRFTEKIRGFPEVATRKFSCPVWALAALAFMPSRPPPAALSVGAPSTSTLLSPWADLASIDAARARALERRKVRHGPSVAELTEGQYASDTRVHYVPAEWTERLARSRANRRQGSEDEGE